LLFPVRYADEDLERFGLAQSQESFFNVKVSGGTRMRTAIQMKELAKREKYRSSPNDGKASEFAGVGCGVVVSGS
jgi:hypothetical protein